MSTQSSTFADQTKSIMEIKTIILDFDGTIADTRQCIIETIRQTLHTMHLPMPEDSAIQALIGLPLRDTFVRAARISDEALITQAVNLYRELFDGICQTTVRLFPHVAETLQMLHAEGVTLTIASSRGKESLEKLLHQLNIAPYITCLFGEEDVQNKKPAPDMALHILAQTGTDRKNALVVGDTQYDILMGQSAGCHTCGVSYGNHTAEMLRAQEADFIIDDFAQLIPLTKQ